MDSLSSIRKVGPFTSIKRSKDRDYLIKPTAITLGISLKMESRSFEINGVSRPESAVVFYEKVIQLLDYYLKTGYHSLSVAFKLSYFNTSSASCLYELMMRLKQLQDQGMNLKVNWYYKIDDEDMLLSGRNFSSYTQLNMRLIPLSTMSY